MYQSEIAFRTDAPIELREACMRVLFGWLIGLDVFVTRGYTSEGNFWMGKEREPSPGSAGSDKRSKMKVKILILGKSRRSTVG